MDCSKEELSISVIKDFSRLLTDLNFSPYPTKESDKDFVTVEWWKVLDGVLLKLKSENFYQLDKEKSVRARWSRLAKKLAKLGRGLLEDGNASPLYNGHWLEAIDARHRYGHNLQFYFEVWKNSETPEPFFYWLDSGEGKNLKLPACPRTKLNVEQINYLAPVGDKVVFILFFGLFSKILQKERKRYEVGVCEGKLVYRETKEFLNSKEGDISIFVLSTTGRLYVGQKEKGKFQHSSFLAGGTATSAGRVTVKNGVLELAEPHSGHYRPTEENFQVFVDVLTDCGVDLSSKIKALSHEQCRARRKLHKACTS